MNSLGNPSHRPTHTHTHRVSSMAPQNSSEPPKANRVSSVDQRVSSQDHFWAGGRFGISKPCYTDAVNSLSSTLLGLPTQVY